MNKTVGIDYKTISVRLRIVKLDSTSEKENLSEKLGQSKIVSKQTSAMLNNETLTNVQKSIF
jgi:hypothetical protein